MVETLMKSLENVFPFGSGEADRLSEENEVRPAEEKL